MSLQTTEIEFKYNADCVALRTFQDFCRRLNPITEVMPAGYDHFYNKTGDEVSFCRHRVGALTNQLTFKRKLQDNNNSVRTEHNIDLSKEMSKQQIEAFLKEFGYKWCSTIYKNAFVYVYDKYSFCYYIVYTEGMEELGRFIEIEMSEEHPWESQEQAYKMLQELEKEVSVVGLFPSRRLKKSLYEMYG